VSLSVKGSEDFINRKIEQSHVKKMVRLKDIKGIAKTTVILLVVIVIIIAAVGAYYVVYYEPAPSEPEFKIAVVSDVGGRGDLSFNDMAFKGGEEAEDDFNVQMVEIISKAEADYVPNLEIGAKDPEVDLIVGVGYLLSEALADVARRYPDKNFAGIDTYAQFLVPEDEYPLPNLMDINYEEHKGSALVGALGTLLAAYWQKPYIGGVFGMEIAVLWKFEVGYKWGCDWAINWTKTNKPELDVGIVATPRKERVLWTYTGTFSDITKGYEAAKPMYAKGAVAVYNIAGPLGLGINQAVEEISVGQTKGPPFWIGVDANQDWINPGFIIASMMKRVDWGVYYATELVDKGIFRDEVANTNGLIILGVGTKVAGELKEGISVSTLDDLDEFIEMGERAEELTGTEMLPMEPAQIRTRVEDMRDTVASWIWDAVAELEDDIRTGAVEVPLADTKETVDSWRDILG
jgi:basic membrane protein A